MCSAFRKINARDSSLFVTFVNVTITGNLLVSNCRNSSSLMSTSGCSSEDTPEATWTFGRPVLLKAAWKINNRVGNAIRK